MDKVIKGIISIISLIGVILLSGCGKKIDEKKCTLLHFGYKSYVSANIVKKTLKNYKVKKTPFLKKNDKRPNFIILTIVTKELNDNGFRGITEFEFYNNQLAEIRFYPEDEKKYCQYFSSKEKTKFKLRGKNKSKNNQYVFNEKNGNTIVRNNLKIEAIQDNQNRYFISWSDISLQEELDRWISLYS